MSRFSDDYDYDGDGTPPEFWEHNLQMALGGKRGQAALRELRDALRALPEKRLIAGALCTVDADSRWAGHNQWYHDDLAENVARQGGEGVCAIGAYLWFKKVKSGMDPRQAFGELPTLLGTDGGNDVETACAAQRAGLTFTLAWHLAYKNDASDYEMTAEERYEAFVAWLDKQLADEPVAA